MNHQLFNYLEHIVQHSLFILSNACHRLPCTLHIHSTVWPEIYYLSSPWTLEGKRREYQFGAILHIFSSNQGIVDNKATIHLHKIFSTDFSDLNKIALV